MAHFKALTPLIAKEFKLDLSALNAFVDKISVPTKQTITGWFEPPRKGGLTLSELRKKATEYNVTVTTKTKEAYKTAFLTMIEPTQVQPPPQQLEGESPIGVFTECIEEQWQKESKTSLWKTGTFAKWNDLKPNNSGNVGEHALHKFCTICKIPNRYEWTKNKKSWKDTNHKTYDMIINSKTVEIKTARIGTNGGFQHESLRNNGSDYYAFIDALPNYVYLTIIPTFNLTEMNNLFFSKDSQKARKPHLRSQTTNVFKFDWTEKHIQNVIEKGFTLKIDSSTSFKDVQTFLNARVI